MNSMGKNSIQIRHEINKGLCRAKHGKTNKRDTFMHLKASCLETGRVAVPLKSISF
jgi:hypothetical protein